MIFLIEIDSAVVIPIRIFVEDLIERYVVGNSPEKGVADSNKFWSNCRRIRDCSYINVVIFIRSYRESKIKKLLQIIVRMSVFVDIFFTEFDIKQISVS